MLFPDGVEQAPRLQASSIRAYALNAIAARLQRVSGEPGRAVPCLPARGGFAVRADGTRVCDRAHRSHNLSGVLHLTGALHAAEASAVRALRRSRVAGRPVPARPSAGTMLAWRAFGTRPAHGDVALHRSLDIRHCSIRSAGRGLVNAFLAQSALWRGEAAHCRSARRSRVGARSSLSRSNATSSVRPASKVRRPSP